MTYERFLKVVLGLKAESERLDILYQAGLDLINYCDSYHTIIQTLLVEIYGEEGYDWISWFCYENDFGQKGLAAWDENKNPICHSFESLWQYVEKLRTAS
jgi:hypothetical protein